MWNRSEISVWSKYSRFETEVNSKWDRSEVDVQSTWNGVESKWDSCENGSEIDVRPKLKWDHVQSKRNRVGLDVRSMWDRNLTEERLEWSRTYTARGGENWWKSWGVSSSRGGWWMIACAGSIDKTRGAPSPLPQISVSAFRLVLQCKIGIILDLENLLTYWTFSAGHGSGNL